MTWMMAKIYWVLYMCKNFYLQFCHDRSSYASAASPTNKDVVLVIDTSSSMKQPSGITAKTKMVIVKEAANNVIQTLKPNDRVSMHMYMSVKQELQY